jgi:hypothetical protein
MKMSGEGYDEAVGFVRDIPVFGVPQTRRLTDV